MIVVMQKTAEERQIEQVIARLDGELRRFATSVGCESIEEVLTVRKRAGAALSLLRRALAGQP